jgi:UDP-N-acetyl-D-glucosamine dehydrogenase
VVDKIQNALNDYAKPVKGSHIHVLGVAYKKNIEDVRESPALDIMLLLKRRGARLTFSDPCVPRLDLDGEQMRSEDTSLAASADCTVVVTDHSAFDYRKIADEAKLIVDTRNAFRGISSPKIVRL